MAIADIKKAYKSHSLDASIYAEVQGLSRAQQLTKIGTLFTQCDFCLRYWPLEWFMYNWKGHKAGPCCIGEQVCRCGKLLSEHTKACVNIPVRTRPQPPQNSQPVSQLQAWNFNVSGTVYSMQRRTRAQEQAYRAGHGSMLRYYGVELELEKTDYAPENTLDICYKILGNLAIGKYDGSLAKINDESIGIELVSAPATLDFHKESGVWKTLFQETQGYFIPFSGTAGMHIHVGLNSLTKLTVAKLLEFIHNPTNLTFVEAMAGRKLSMGGTAYAAINPQRTGLDIIKYKRHRRDCPWHPAFRDRVVVVGELDSAGKPILKALTKENTIVRKVCRCNPGTYEMPEAPGTKGPRYEALSVHTSKPTIEFRMFAGVTTYDRMMQNLEFCDSLIQFLEASPRLAHTSLEYLQYFLKNCKSSHKLLYGKLQEMGLVPAEIRRRRI